MSGCKETTNSLLFFSAKDFLESVGVNFEFRFQKITKRDKYLLQYRRLPSESWEQKPISFCLRYHTVLPGSLHYMFVPIEVPEITPAQVEDEAKWILDLTDYLNARLVQATLGQFGHRQPRTYSVTEIAKLRIFAPYGFQRESFPTSWTQIPGLPTIRLGQGYANDYDLGKDHTYRCGFFYQFNNWRYQQILDRRTKRARSPSFSFGEESQREPEPTNFENVV